MPWPVSSPADAPAAAPSAVGFQFLEGRLRAAVEGVAGNDPNPTDPFRGLYISDEDALNLAAGEASTETDGRLAAATRLLGLDLLDSAR